MCHGRETDSGHPFAKLGSQKILWRFWDLERLCQSIQIATLCNSLDTRFASSWLHKGRALKRDTPLGQIYPAGRLDSQLMAALVDSCYGAIILNHAVTSILESQWISSGWSRTRTHSLILLGSYPGETACNELWSSLVKASTDVYLHTYIYIYGCIYAKNDDLMMTYIEGMKGQVYLLKRHYICSIPPPPGTIIPR